jgi:hypothetical protein
MAVLLKFARWLLAKSAMAVVIVAGGLAVYGLWQFLRDNVDLDLRHNELVRVITGERAQVKAALGDVETRLAQNRADIAAAQERIRQIDSIIQRLKELESTWDKVVGNREQQEANAAQLVRMGALHREAVAELTRLQTQLTRTTWERDGLQVALGRLDIRLQEVNTQRSRFVHYVQDLWARTRFWLLLALAVYFLGPTVGKLVLYYGVAPLITRGRPVRLVAEMPALPEIAESRVALNLSLPPGTKLWLKERFLQTADEGLERKTRFLLDWRIPFTCLASGLIELVEMHQPASAATARQVTLSNEADPSVELALVTLPAGSALVLRPSYLIGVGAGAGERLVIRRRWQLFRWQSWITLQFRFFEFAGPCRLIVAGSRGVRAERLDDPAAARRTNQDSTIGFTPNLDYLPARAETFWGYYRGMNPLFDDLFAGRGFFLCQQVSAAGDAARARKFWAGLWSGTLKAFGL